MAKYDLNDPTDVDIMKAQFDMISHEEWDEYIELAEEMKLGYKNVNILKSASRKTGMSKYMSVKLVNWVMSLVDRIEEEQDEYEDDDDDEED